MGQVVRSTKGSERDGRLGTHVGGDVQYEILGLLRTGGMSRVYAARHSVLRRRAVIKFLLPEHAADPDLVGRFEAEARIAGALEHENIAAVIDFGHADDGAAFIVMEHLDGQDLEELLAKEGALSVPRAIAIALQACRGIDVAHRAGVIHRDLKPANIFLCRRANGAEMVKLLDFGVAKQAGTRGGTPTSGPIGTCHYMSPEQARGSVEIDVRSDVYALGAILYEMLAGRRAHDGEQPLEVVHRILTKRVAPIATLRPGLDPALCDVIERAMAFEPEGRFSTASELAEALRWWSVDAETKAVSTDVGTPTRPSLDARSSEGVSSANASGKRISRSRVAAAKLRRWPVLAAFAALAVLVSWASSAFVRRESSARPSAIAPTAPSSERALLFPTPLESAAPAAAVDAVRQAASAPLAQGRPAVSNIEPSAGGSSKKRDPRPPVPIAASPPGSTSLAHDDPPDCRTPFRIDEQGDKVFKRECL